MPDLGDLMSTLSAQTGPRFRRLNKAMAGLLDDYRWFHSVCSHTAGVASRENAVVRDPAQPRRNVLSGPFL